MDIQQENAPSPSNHQRRIKRLANETTPASNKAHTTQSLEFVARVISLPVAQESLLATQSLASQFGLGRALLDQTHSLIQRTIHYTQTSPTYHTFVDQNQVLQRTLGVMDGWACAVLDEIETTVPLIQQPTATIVHTLIVQPRQRIAKVLGLPWGKVRQRLDKVELWMVQKKIIIVAPSSMQQQQQQQQEGKSLNERLVYLGGSAFSRVIQVGKDQAKRIWSDRPLLSQNGLSPLSATLSN